MDQDDEMIDYDEIMEVIARIPKHPPVKVETVKGFLKEIRRISAESLLDFPLAEFKPFWESMLLTARAAMCTDRAPEPKWLSLIHI